MPNPLISKLTVGSTTYDIKDAQARADIETLKTYTKFLGVTTTALTDGATTNPITIGGEQVTAATGDIVTYGSKEFIWNGSAWQEFGDLSAITSLLGELAYEDTAVGSYTPAGTVSVTPTTDNVYSITDVGTLPTVSPSTDTVYSITDVGTLPTVSPSTDTVYSITDVGTLPSFSYDSATETLEFSAGALPTKGSAQTVVSDVGYTAGTLPTKGSAQTVVSDVGYTAGTLPTKGTAQAVMTGATASFSGTAATITVAKPST